MHDDLSRLSSAEIDALPFGYIALALDGTVRKYNRYEADLARKDPQEVLGRSFFRAVAPCTQVQAFEGRFRDFVEGGETALTFEFEFRFRHGRQMVRIGFLRTPLDAEVIVTVNRVRDLELPLTAGLRLDPVRGRVEDETGQAVIVAGGDFWRSLDGVWSHLPPERRREALQRLGREWAERHIQRVERQVQREAGRTLRETELQYALEILYGSLGLLGLGRFEVDLGLRQQGVVMIRHLDSPFADLLGEREDPCCDLLAGLHAGFLSHLSGRTLSGAELRCSRATGESCRFLCATETRLSRLLDPQRALDPAILAALGPTVAVAAVR